MRKNQGLADAPQDNDADAMHAGQPPNRNDRLHDQKLLRDLEAVNGRMARAHGPLPPGGQQVQSKRSPQ